MLLQVFLQPGQQPGLQSSGRQSSLLLQQWLQREQLGLPSAGSQLPAASPARLDPLRLQIVTTSLLAKVHLRSRMSKLDSHAVPITINSAHSGFWPMNGRREGVPGWSLGCTGRLQDVWLLYPSRCVFQWILLTDASLASDIKRGRDAVWVHLFKQNNRGIFHCIFRLVLPFFFFFKTSLTCVRVGKARVAAADVAVIKYGTKSSTSWCVVTSLAPPTCQSYIWQAKWDISEGGEKTALALWQKST